jgi:branched-chain amino acid transport system permease protein
MSASLIGLTGAIYAYFIHYINPPGAFDIGTSIKMFVIVLLGGVGTVFGPVIGAFGIQILETEVISSNEVYDRLRSPTGRVSPPLAQLPCR